jgi:multidrug efflux pump subunit AcrA (membrane-fusion protein)
MKKTIMILLGVILLSGAFYGAKFLMDSKTRPKPKEQKLVTAVFAETVKNTHTPITITTSGNLVAKNKVELFSEVQGIFEKSDKLFKPGTYYGKGETLLKINSDEYFATIQTQKSSLYNQLVLFLPDLRLDYPDAFPKWEKYVREFSMDQTLLPLPEPATEKEKLFLSGRNVFTAWYSVKNLEERLVKYKIVAPFSGVLTDALVNPGTLIRQGQKLGEYIDPGVYELEVAVNAAFMELLKVGKTVALDNLEHTKSWSGKVVRVNGRVSPATQTVQVFIQVSSNDLKEGMYLEAEVQAKEEANTCEVSRKLLVNNEKLFVVKDSILDYALVTPVYFTDKTVVVRGLEDGTLLLSRAVPGAYAGMKVKVLE